MNVPVLVNPGGGSAGDDALEKVSAALEAAGIAGDVQLCEGEELEPRARAAVEAGADLLIAAGGDGTMSAVAGALAGTNTALGLIPLGTLNHLARDLAIPFEPEEAARVIAAGERRTIDVAELDGRVFVNNSAIGLYPLMVVDRDLQQRRLGRSKRLAMLVASLRTLARFHEERLTLTINDSHEGMLDTPLLFVGNNQYSLALPGAGCRDRLDDGELCVLVMRKKGALGLLTAALRALVGLTRHDDMVRLDGVRSLTVASRRSHLTVSLDGETISAPTPLHYRIRSAALSVVVPSSSKAVRQSE